MTPNGPSWRSGLLAAARPLLALALAGATLLGAAPPAAAATELREPLPPGEADASTPLRVVGVSGAHLLAEERDGAFLASHDSGATWAPVNLPQVDGGWRQGGNRHVVAVSGSTAVRHDIVTGAGDTVPLQLTPAVVAARLALGWESDPRTRRVTLLVQPYGGEVRRVATDLDGEQARVLLVDDEWVAVSTGTVHDVVQAVRLDGTARSDVVVLDGEAGRTVTAGGAVHWIRDDQQEVEACSRFVGATMGPASCHRLTRREGGGQPEIAGTADYAVVSYQGVSHVVTPSSAQPVQPPAGVRLGLVQPAGKGPGLVNGAGDGPRSTYYWVDATGRLTRAFDGVWNHRAQPATLAFGSGSLWGAWANRPPVADGQLPVWRRAVSGAIGPEEAVGARAAAVAGSGARVVTAGAAGLTLFDRGVEGRVAPTSQRLALSGPYLLTDQGVSLVDGTELDAKGAVALFGSRALLQQGSTWVVRDLRGNRPDTTLPAGIRWNGIWGDQVYGYVAGRSEHVHDLATGVTTQLPHRVVGAGDGYYRTATEVVVTATGATVPLDGSAAVAEDGNGRFAFSDGSDLVVRTLDQVGRSRPRVLGWLAPRSVPSGTRWTPQVDVTKGFGAGVLRVSRDGAVVAEVPVPASADGAVRDVAWDGRTTAGLPAPAGDYTVELVAQAADGTGAVADVDGVSPATATVTVEPAYGSFVGVTPARLLDTRESGGVVAGKSEVTLPVTGRGGVPAQVSAVVLNVTAVAPQGAGFVTVYPSGAERPWVSNLNFDAGRVVPNLVTVKVGGDGSVRLFNGSPGHTHLVVDVVGYFVGGGEPSLPGAFVPLVPDRVLDTREPRHGATPVAARTSRRLTVTGQAGVPAADQVSAVVLNVTVVDPATPGFLTVSPTGVERPLVSNLNYTPGAVVANQVVAKVGDGGSIELFNGSTGTVHVVVDVAGYVKAGEVTASGMYVPVTPQRVMDTRTSLGAAGPVAGKDQRSLSLLGAGGLPATGVSAVVVNVTVTEPALPGYVTVYPGGGEAPLASNLNFEAGQTVPNLTMVGTGPGGTVAFTNGSVGPTHLIADVSGYYTA